MLQVFSTSGSHNIKTQKQLNDLKKKQCSVSEDQRTRLLHTERKQLYPIALRGHIYANSAEIESLWKTVTVLETVSSSDINNIDFLMEKARACYVVDVNH